MAEVNQIKLSKDQLRFLETWAVRINLPKGGVFFVVNKYWFLSAYDRVFFVLEEKEVSDEAKVLKKELDHDEILLPTDFKLYGHLNIPLHDINQGFCTPETLEGQKLSAGYGYVVSDDANIYPMYIHNNVMRETNPVPGPCSPGVYKLWRRDGSF